MAHVDKRLPKLKEYILVYGKGRSARVNPVKVKKDSSDSLDKYLKYYGKIIENPGDQPEKWSIIPVLDFMKKNGYDLSEESIRNFKVNNAQRCVYRTNNKSFEKLNIESKIARITSSTGLEYIWWEGKQMLFLSDYIEETLGDLWTDISTINLNKEGGVNLPNGKKPEKLIARIIDIATKPGDIVLDYHLGSGTTAAVAHKMKRQYIGVEQLYYGDNDPTKRLQNVINGDQSGMSKSLNWQGSGSFVYTNIMNNSNKFRKRVEAAKNDTDYLSLLKEAMSSSFLSYRVDPKKINEEEFRKLSAAEKRRLLLELIDNNTLYVNYEDINDPIFKVSEKDKKLNAVFYNATNEDRRAE